MISSRYFETIEADVTLKDLTEAREAFITSTTKRVLPITKIDDQSIGDGVPGSVSAKLLEELVELENADYSNSITSR